MNCFVQIRVNIWSSKLNDMLWLFIFLSFSFDDKKRNYTFIRSRGSLKKIYTQKQLFKVAEHSFDMLYLIR